MSFLDNLFDVGTAICSTAKEHADKILDEHNHYYDIAQNKSI